MNIRRADDRDKVEKLLQILNLSEANAAIARAYLTEEADDGVLAGAEHQNFVELTMAQRMAVVSMIGRMDNDWLIRFYKLFWAIGKGTAALLFTGWSVLTSRKDRQWCIDVLGKSAAAAMEATEIAWQVVGRTDTSWLHMLAETEPEVLEEAQKLDGTPEGYMAAMLAGILLCHVGNSPLKGLLQHGGRIHRQREILLNANLNYLRSGAAGLSDADRMDLEKYIQNVAHWLPVPRIHIQPTGNPVSGGAFPAGLLGAACFLAAKHAPQGRTALRVYANLNIDALLGRIIHTVPHAILMERLETLLRELPRGGVDMLLFLTSQNLDMERCREIAHKCRFSLNQAVQQANPEQYMKLCAMFPDTLNPTEDDQQERILEEVKNNILSGEPELERYMLSTGSLLDSARALANVERRGYSYPSTGIQLMGGYRKRYGWNDFACRCAVVLGLIFNGGGMYVLAFNNRNLDAKELREMLDALLARDLPVVDLMNILGEVVGYSYQEEVKQEIQDVLRETAGRPEYLEQLCTAAQKGGLYARSQSIALLQRLYEESACADRAREGILACTGDSSKQIREQLMTILPAHPEWSEDYRAMLKSKKSAQRMLAAQILGQLGQQMRPILEEALASEKSSKVADVIRGILGQEAATETPAEADVVQQLMKKAKKVKWLLDSPLPAVRRKNGEVVSDEQRGALLVAYCELGRIGRSETAADLAREMEEADLAALAQEVFELWMAEGAPSEHKWVLAFAAVFGGPAMTAKLLRAINDWPQNARGAIACDAVTALSLSQDPAALLAVDAISRKFKFRQVRKAAAAALENAAAELGITAEELADRIVPDLGFGADGKRVFDYGARQFTVRLTPALELEITNHQGKAVKNLPAPGKTDDPEKAAAAYDAFKTMKKQIRTTVTTQKARLEQALSALRCWNSVSWRSLFVDNPIMHQFAIGLVWGVYQDGILETTFRYMEDGSFNTVDEDEYDLPEQASIGLVHPVELDTETLDGWRQQLEDYEITQPIVQLERPVYLPAAQADCFALETFGGKMLNCLSLSGKLLGMGWFRGSVQDGGVYDTFYREDAAQGLGVELRFSGCYAGDENETVTVYDAVFYRAGTVKRGSYCYDTPKESDLFALSRIPARYYSEIVYQLERATASSTETEAQWKEMRGRNV